MSERGSVLNRQDLTLLLWPGVLIFAAVAAVVGMGWKANLD